MDYKNKKVLVIGLARSGKATIRVLAKLGARIYLSEKNQLTEEDQLFLKQFDVESLGQEMEVFGQGVGHQFSFVDDDDVVAHRLHLLHDVSGEQHRTVLPV